MTRGGLGGPEQCPVPGKRKYYPRWYGRHIILQQAEHIYRNKYQGCTPSTTKTAGLPNKHSSPSKRSGVYEVRGPCHSRARWLEMASKVLREILKAGEQVQSSPLWRRAWFYFQSVASFKILGTVTSLPRGQRRRNLPPKTRHCSRNTCMPWKRRKSDHTAASGRHFLFFGSESRPPLDLPPCTIAVLRKEWCCWTTSSYDSGVLLWFLITLSCSMLWFLCATKIVLSCPPIAYHVENLSDM